MKLTLRKWWHGYVLLRVTEFHPGPITLALNE